MALAGSIRKFVFQNATSGKVYEVKLIQNTDGTIDGTGLLIGTNPKGGGDPTFDNTKVTFVVITAQIAKFFGTAYQQDTALAYAAYYDAASRVAGGAALSTLLV